MEGKFDNGTVGPIPELSTNTMYASIEDYNTILLDISKYLGTANEANVLPDSFKQTHVAPDENFAPERVLPLLEHRAVELAKLLTDKGKSTKNIQGEPIHELSANTEMESISARTTDEKDSISTTYVTAVPILGNVTTSVTVQMDEGNNALDLIASFPNRPEEKDTFRITKPFGTLTLYELGISIYVLERSILALMRST